MSVKVKLTPLSTKEAELFLAVGIVLLIAFILISLMHNLHAVGSGLGDILKTDDSKVAIIAIAFVATIGIGMIYAKIDDPITLFTIGLGVAAILFVALFWKEIEGRLSNISSILPPSESEIEKIRAELYKEYANPNNNEVYFPGNNNVKQYAKAAHVDLHTSPITEKDFICVVYTGEILEIDDSLPDAKSVWNRIYFNKAYPLNIYVNGKEYWVWCRCDLRDVDWRLNSTVCCPSGKCYDCNSEYRHMPKNDAIYIMNHPPVFLSNIKFPW